MKYTVLIIMLCLIFPSSLFAQDTTEQKQDQDKWVIYGDHFKKTAGSSTEKAAILEGHGHVMLKTELQEATEEAAIKLRFIIDNEDLSQLFQQIDQMQMMPKMYEDSVPDPAKLKSAKYIIIPKFFIDEDSIRVDIGLYPLREGAVSIPANAIFKTNEVNSGIKKLADSIAAKIFEKEGIKFDPQSIRYPRVGIRDFKNETTKEEYDGYSSMIPSLIRSRLAETKSDNFEIYKMNIGKDEIEIRDNEISEKYDLNILITGTLYTLTQEKIILLCTESYANGQVIGSQKIVIHKDDDIVDKINKVADEIKLVFDKM